MLSKPKAARVERCGSTRPAAAESLTHSVAPAFAAPARESRGETKNNTAVRLTLSRAKMGLSFSSSSQRAASSAVSHSGNEVGNASEFLVDT